MKGCNQVARANLPHPVRLTCQNASPMTQGLVCWKKTMKGGGEQSVCCTRKDDVFNDQSVLHFGI